MRAWMWTYAEVTNIRWINGFVGRPLFLEIFMLESYCFIRFVSSVDFGTYYSTYKSSTYEEYRVLSKLLNLNSSDYFVDNETETELYFHKNIHCLYFCL